MVNLDRLSLESIHVVDNAMTGARGGLCNCTKEVEEAVERVTHSSMESFMMILHWKHRLKTDRRLSLQGWWKIKSVRVLFGGEEYIVCVTGCI